MNVTTELIKNLIDTSYEDLPPETRNITKKTILDTFGAILIGTGIRSCKVVVDLVCEWGGKEQSTVVNYGIKVPVHNAVFANCSMARATELDDVYEKGALHSSVTVVPVAFAVAEYVGEVNGEDLITAVTLGNDVTCRIGVAHNIAPQISGFSHTCVAGVFGAAAAAGKLMGFDEEKMLNGMGIAYEQAMGTRAPYTNQATVIPVHQGRIGSVGVVSALLAEKGITASKDPLQGRYGYYAVIEKNDYNPTVITDNLGETFLGDDVSVKLYSCCKFAHGAIEGTLFLINKHSITPEDICEVTVKTNEQMYDHLSKPPEYKMRPRSRVDAQFSMYYAVATAIVRRSAFVDDYTDEAVKNTEVLKVAEKVRPTVDPELDREFRNEISPTIVEIKLNNGQQYTRRVDYVKGHPKNPVSFDDIEKKFKKCAGYAVNPLTVGRLDEICEAIKNLERVQDLKQIVKLTTPIA